MTTGPKVFSDVPSSLWRSSRSTRRQRHPRGFVGASRAHRNGAAGGAVVRRRDIAGTVVQPSPAALSRAARRGRGASVELRRPPEPDPVDLSRPADEGLPDPRGVVASESVGAEGSLEPDPGIRRFDAHDSLREPGPKGLCCREICGSPAW
jgi:hypothetical protein